MRRALLAGLAIALFVSEGTLHADPSFNPFYLPDSSASRSLSVTPPGATAPSQAIIVLTVPVAIKETGPAATIRAFGEVYAFSPSLFVVTEGVPVRIAFWNLQPDDEHDVMIADPSWRVLLHLDLPPLQKIAYDFTFHAAGVYPFVCTMHGPAMSGQILVLPPTLSWQGPPPG